MIHLPAHLAKPRGTPHTHLVFSSAISPVGTPLSADWRQFNCMMQMAGHEKVANKLHAKLITPWSPIAGEIGRRSEAFGYATMLVFDLDKIDTMDIDDVISWCRGSDVLVHTTFSHGVDGYGCFRIYMLLDESINADQYRTVHAAVLATLPELAKRVDPSCADPVRCYFMPSCPSERHHLAETRPSFGGNGIEVAKFLTNSGTPVMAPLGAPIAPSTQTKSTTSTAIAALMPPPATKGQRNQVLVSLAGRAYAKGYTPEALLPEAQDWGQRCTPPMDPSEVAATVNSMWKTHARNNPQQEIREPAFNAPASDRYLLTAAELMALPPLDWCVRGVLPRRGLCSIYGASGSGKTFLAIHLALAIAFQRHWFGKHVSNAPVVYVALEGESGISQRLQAWEKEHSQSAPANLRFVIRSVSLMEAGECDVLAAEIVSTVGQGTVIFIDTLNRAAPAADENTSADMGRVIESAKRLADAVVGLVILVHHSGKDAGRGMRGHSSLFAAMDAVLEVTSAKPGREWSIAKSKDSVDGVRQGFDLRAVNLGRDKWAMDVTSCVVVPAAPGRLIPTRPLRGAQQNNAYEVLSTFLGDAQTNPQGIATRSAAEAAVAQVLTCDPKRKAERARALVDSLINSGHFSESNGYLSKP